MKKLNYTETITPDIQSLNNQMRDVYNSINEIIDWNEQFSKLMQIKIEKEIRCDLEQNCIERDIKVDKQAVKSGLNGSICGNTLKKEVESCGIDLGDINHKVLKKTECKYLVYHVFSL